MNNAISRRDFIKSAAIGAAGLSLFGCDTRPSVPQEGLQNLINSGMQFVDRDGNLVNLQSRQKSVAGDYSTVSFMYYGCGTSCPTVSHELADATKKNSSLQNFIVSVNPEMDYYNHMLDKTLLAQDGFTKRNMTVLYPVTKLGTSPNNHTFATAEEVATKIEQAESGFKLVMRDNQAEAHETRVYVYSPRGYGLDVLSTGNIVSGIENLVSSGKGR